MSKAVAYDDLLGVRWESGAMDVAKGALDCAGVTAEVLLRVHGARVRDEFIKAMHGLSLSWRQLEDSEAPMVGDVVLSTPKAGLHASAVVSVDPLLSISSSDPLGCYVVRVSAMTNVSGVYRYCG